MNFIFPKNYNFKNKFLGFIDYPTIFLNIIWDSIIFLIINCPRLSLGPMRIIRIEKHSGADAVTAAGTFEDIVVNTAFATSPESLVVCQVSKGNRYIS